MNTRVRTRIAPSPTGAYHIGHMRTCLYNYALARKNGGDFIVRIEDTDQKRYVSGAIEGILADIRDYGLDWDEGIDVGGDFGPYKQTERLEIYKKYIGELLDKGYAYYCFCSQERLDKIREIQKKNKQIPKYDRHCLNLTKEEIETKIKAGKSYVIRMKMPGNEIVEFNDLVRGTIKINTNDLDDQVLIKSDGIPTYHFAVVVDDHLMKISHVLRGEEWISSTPKQILLYKFFGWNVPVFCHLTVFLDPDGRGKMSKRKGSVSARSFLDEGYLSEALLNFLMLLGWNPGTDKEIFSLEEFVKEFSLERLHKKSPIFDRKKLDYFNSYYIRLKTDNQFFDLVKPFFKKELAEVDVKKLKVLAPLLRDRTVTLKQAVELGRFVFEEIEYDLDAIETKIKDKNLARQILSDIIVVLKKNDFESQTMIQDVLIKLAEAKNYNKGDFFMALRIGLSGNSVTPPIVECMPLIGKETCIDRLKRLIKELKE